MIVVDTSALMTVLFEEAGAKRIQALLKAEEAIVISAGTLAEARIVALGADMVAELEDLLDAAGMDVEAVSEADSRSVSEAYSKWGKGFHAARLNFGDCFAYATAKRLNAPLLFVGDGFSKTDITPAM